MKAVVLNSAMRPFGSGDIAFLPDDVADKIIADGDGVAVNLGGAPHARELRVQPVTAAPRKGKLSLPASAMDRAKQLLETKGGR
ncbi:MAG: hypothetical protein E6G97_25940 [Alphaproteobacteria bacterium]|nr:MAG: hypothetical protein E6G97_25940 [Alphaproteobacteria bacterium]